MTKPKQYRWTCPQCGKGKLAGKAPRRNATVRFCLPCSDKAGVLVVRACAVLDAERERGKAKAEGKAKRKAAKRKDTSNAKARAEHKRLMVARCRTRQDARLRELDAVDEHYNLAAVDLHAELDKLLSCRCVPSRLRQSGVELHLRQAAREPSNRWGFASIRNAVPYISLSVWPGMGASHLLGGLCHELAHHMTWREESNAHGKKWRQAYCELVREHYDVVPEGNPRYLPARWDLDRALGLGLAPIAKAMMRVSE